MGLSFSEFTEILRRRVGDPKGNAWRCPAHDDRQASLSVMLGDGGKILAFCHAGCSVKDICDSLDIQVSDLFPDDSARRPAPPRRDTIKRTRAPGYATIPEAVRSMFNRIRAEDKGAKFNYCWVYKDLLGGDYAAVARFDLDAPENGARRKKTFRPIFLDDGLWRIGDPPQFLPFRAERLSANKEKVILWVEGEKCVSELNRIGIEACTSAHGAGSPTKTRYDSLAGFTVFIFPDADEAGLNYAGRVAEMLRGIGADPIVLKPILDAPHADVADYISVRTKAGHTPEKIRLSILKMCDDEVKALNEQEENREEGFDLRMTGPIADAFIRRLQKPKDPKTPPMFLVSMMDQFYLWRGDRYTVPEGEDEVTNLVWKFMEGLKDSKGRPLPVNPSTVRSVVQTLGPRSFESVMPHRGDVSPPFRIGSDPKHRKSCGDLIFFPNGTLSIEDGSFTPPDRRIFNLHCADYEYLPNAPEPTKWKTLLSQIWPGDQHCIELLQEFFGLCLTAETKFHKGVLLCGPKRSGKSTISRILTAMVGWHNVCFPPLSQLGGNFSLQPFLGKTVAILNDARLSHRSDAQAIVERINSITGEDSITVDRKHKEAVSCRLRTRFFIITNEVPRLSDNGGALASRFLILETTHSYLGKEDTELYGKLLPEVPGILLWAIEGLKRLEKRGRFSEPERSKELRRLLEDSSSPISAFVRECAVIDASAECLESECYDCWKKWCEMEGIDHPGGKQTFVRNLKAAVPGVRTLGTKRRFGLSESVGVDRVLCGIRLATRDDPPPGPSATSANEPKKVQEEDWDARPVDGD